MSSNPRRLKSITVEGMFGTVDYSIVLDKDRPTVLTGANGTGKSTLLKLVSAASNGDLTTLAAAPIARMKLEIDGTDDFEMIRNTDSHGFRINWGPNTGHIKVSRFLDELPDWAITSLEDHQFNIESTLEDLADSASSADAEFEEYRDAREALTRADRVGTPLRAPEWFPEFTKAFPVLFVSDQRLVTESKIRPRGATAASRAPVVRTTNLAVEAASVELAARIREADSDYARSSQQIDRRLPQRILETMTASRPASNELLSELVTEASDRREELRLVGLLDESQFEPELKSESLQDENIRRVMSAVIRSTLQKLAVLDDLQARLSSFKSFLDDRFEPKLVELSRNEGMRFKLPNGQRIRPRQLSSGEQQMTVLAFEILFRARPGTLVIVDEPELSLHVLWQDTLIKDLSRMGDASGVQFLMATHSPIILGDYPELERPLKRARR